MTLIILRFLSKSRYNLHKSKVIYYFLILIAMLVTQSATPQVMADFTTVTSNTGCGSLVVDFEDLSSGNPDAWLWDFGNGNTSTLQHPVAVYANPGMYDVTLTVSNSSSNNTHIATGLIKVYQQPTAELASFSPTSGCMPLAVDFQDLSTSSNTIVDWQWDFGDGGGSTQQQPTYEYALDGNYSVSLSVTDVNGCESLATQVNFIEVFRKPIVDFSADILFSCNSTELVTFTNNTLGATAYLWDFGDGTSSTMQSPPHNYNTGQYTIELIAANGSCTDTLVVNNYIEIGAVLNPEFISDVNSGCENLMVSFTDITANNPDSWIWDFGDGYTSNLQNPSHNYLNPGVYDVSLTTSKSGQCTNNQTIVGAIEVFAKPDVQILADTMYGCTTPLVVEFSDNTINSTSWNWNFGNGFTSNMQNPATTYNTFGSYDVSLTVSNTDGCAKNVTFSSFIQLDDIQVNINADTLQGCIPFTTNFTDITNSIRPITSWLWDFGDGNTSNIQNPNHQFITSGNFDITFGVKNDYGCIATNTFNAYIQVDEPPIVDLTASVLVSCAGNDIVFSDLSTPSSSSISSWIWDFGDGNTSNTQNPTYQYQLSGIFDVSLVASVNGCTDTLVKPNYIEIIEPSAFFMETYDCDNPLTVDFTNLSIGADNVLWDFDDGTTSTLISPTHTFPGRGTYNVSLTVTNTITACSHEIIIPVTITIPQADFTYLINPNNSLEDSVGCTPHRVYLTDLSQDAAYFRMLWEDGFIGYGRLDHTFTDLGTFDVTMVVTDMHGCKDTLVHQDMYTINGVTAEFGITNVLGCDSMFVAFEDLTTPTSSVSWDFGDGGTSVQNNPQHIYYAPGFYDVTLFAESVDDCFDTITKVEYIQFQYPVADFSASTVQSCPNSSIQFLNSSVGIGLNYSWDFGNGTTSVAYAPNHSYTTNGNYDIILSVVDSFGCPNAKTMSNYINIQQPTAQFVSGGVSSNCPPLISSFTDQSSADVISWIWDFGDGETSNITSPSHLFTQSGSFDIALIVSNAIGCSDTLVQNDLVQISGPIGSFSVSDSLVCTGDTIQFVANVQNTDTYLWDFGDGSFSTDSNPSNTYISSGVYAPSLIIENAAACQLIVQIPTDIEVREVVVDAGINNTICLGEELTLNAVGNGLYYLWTPSASLNNATVQNPISSTTNSTTYYVEHSDGMCSTIDSVQITVNTEVPNPSFTTENHCEGLITDFTASSGLLTNNLSWQWSFGDNTQYPSQQLVVGSNLIGLIVENLDNGCVDSIVQNVEIFALPLVDFNASEECLGFPTLFTDNSSTNVVSFDWNFGDSIGNSSMQNLTYEYLNSGAFAVNLHVVSNEGCENDTTKVVQVNALPTADFSVENVCEGAISLFADNSTISSGTIVGWNYNFGDSSTNQNTTDAQHQYLESGLFLATLQVLSDKGCTHSTSKNTTVFAVPDASFSAQEFCLGTPTQFSDYSTVGNATIVSWDWNFGDGIGAANSQHPTYTYKSPEEFGVSLTVITNEGCMHTISNEITINSLPNASLDVINKTCLGNKLEFTDESFASNQSIVAWNWDFGDGNFSSEQHPHYTYTAAGLFDVGLSVITSMGCTSDKSTPTKVQVVANPIADFIPSTLSASEINNTIAFYNASSGAVFYEWDFDNGTVTNDEHAEVTFHEVRNYDVFLYVRNEDGCESSMVKTVNIYPEYTFYIPNAFTPNDDGYNDVFTVKGNGITEFELQIFDRWGGLIFESSNVEYGWNGTNFSGERLNEGVYMYHISLKDYNGKLWVYNGELNLMR